MPFLPLIMSSSSFLSKLGSGDYVGAFSGIYTSVMGDLFWGAVMGLIFIPMFMRTKSILYLSVVALVTAGFMLYFLPPTVQPILYLTFSLEFALLMVKLYNR